MKHKFIFSLFVLLFVMPLGVNLLAQGGLFEVGPLMNRTRIVPPAATLDDGRIVLFGGREEGFISCSYADIYDPAMNTFTEVSMNNPHDATCVIKLQDGKYLVLGGSMNSGVAPGYNVCEIYDPVDDSFTLSTPMTYSRMMHNGTQLADGKILVVGAWYNDQGAATAEVLDLQTGTNVLTNSLNTPRAAALVLPCDDGNAMVVGGFGSYGSGNYTSIEEFDHTTNSFSLLSDQIINSETDWHANSYSVNRPSSEYRLSDGRYVFLAYRSAPDLEYIMVAFDPADKTFTKLYTQEPILSGVANGGIYDFVIDIPNNRAYILGLAAGAVNPQVGIIGVDLTTGYIQHPTSTFDFPADEYLYPTLAYTPYSGKILLTGVSASSSTYFSATNKTYLITPDDLVGLNDQAVHESMSVFPNPTSGTAWIKIFSSTPGIIELNILDQTGKLVYSQNRSVGIGQQQLQIETNVIASGIYNLKICLHNAHGAQQHYVTKLVVK